MSDIRNLDTFLYYYNEANKLSPFRLEEKRERHYMDYGAFKTLACPVERSVMFKTSSTYTTEEVGSLAKRYKITLSMGTTL